jgi:hypothetical protein
MYASVMTIDIRGSATEAAIMYPRFYALLVSKLSQNIGHRPVEEVLTMQNVKADKAIPRICIGDTSEMYV